MGVGVRVLFLNCYEILLFVGLCSGVDVGVIFGLVIDEFCDVW